MEIGLLYGIVKRIEDNMYVTGLLRRRKETNSHFFSTNFQIGSGLMGEKL